MKNSRPSGVRLIVNKTEAEWIMLSVIATFRYVQVIRQT